MKPATLLQAVNSINGMTFIGMDTSTDVKLKGGQKNPMQGRVTKAMRGARVMAFQNKEINGYDAIIKRRLIAEGKNPNSFVLGKRAWGTRIPNLPIVEHFKDGDTHYYLEVIYLEPGHVEYFLDGNPIAKSAIIGLEEKAEGEQGGLDDTVIIRSFKADSIVELRVNRQVFR